MLTTRLSRRDAATALVQAYLSQRPEDGVAYLSFAIYMPAARWAEIIEALRPLAGE